MTKRRQSTLDLLRFLVAIFIVVFHFGRHLPNNITGPYPIFNQGWVGTDFFILLSGYILSKSYLEKLASGELHWSQFAMRRLLRIWPIHATVMLGFGAIVWFGGMFGIHSTHGTLYEFRNFCGQLFLLQAFTNLGDHDWNLPTWTLSSLFLCYLVFASFAKSLFKLERAHSIILALTIVLSVNIVAIFQFHHSFVDLTFEHALFRTMPLFFLGALLPRIIDAKLFELGNRSNPMAQIFTILLMFAIVYSTASLPRSTAGDWFIIAVLAFVVLFADHIYLPGQKLQALLGKASFSLYLIHTPVSAIGFAVIEKLQSLHVIDANGAILGWFGLTIFTIIFAIVFEIFVDRPLAKYCAKIRIFRANSVAFPLFSSKQ